MPDIRTLTEKLTRFRDERNWMQFHNHKDMAISLALEAAEVLEHFQWKSPEAIAAHVRAHREDIGEELADVAAYLFELAENLGVDLAVAIERKMAKNELKYPVEKAYGVATKYTELA